MYCRKCGAQIPGDSIFCGKCGVKLGDAPAAGPAAATPAPALAPSKAPSPDELEQTLWQGRYCGRALGPWYLLWAIWLVLIAYVYWFKLESPERTATLNIVFLLLTAGPLGYLGFLYLKKSWTVRYRLTTHRLFCEVGLFSRKVSEVELFRVDDVSVKQNLLQRIFSVGDVSVISTDSTEPRLDMLGIDKPIETKEQIRTYVRRRRDRAMFMENI